MTNEERIIVLEAHAVKLDQANTFEEYKAAHIEYIEYLIAVFRLEDRTDVLTMQFVGSTDANPS